LPLYFAKFFHRPPGDRDRMVLLVLGLGYGADLVMTIALDGRGNDTTRREYPASLDAILAFRTEAERWRADEYVETDQTDHTLNALPSDPQPKPAWQAGLDDLLLAQIAREREREPVLIAALSTTPACEQPFYLWMAARQHFRTAPEDLAGAEARAAAARDALAARRAANLPCYVWSLSPHVFEGSVHDLLCKIHLAAGDPAAALAAIDRACVVASNSERRGLRGWILCSHFPERQDEAFHDAQRHPEAPEYDRIRALPAYAAYLERTQPRRGSAGWRWSGRRPRADPAALREAEQALGATLPDDYRRFLATDGRDKLLVRVEHGSATLEFHAPGELATERANFYAFVTGRGPPAEKTEAYVMERHRIALRDLVPVAQPVDASNAILIHLGRGDMHGWYYRWYHDDAWELERLAPSFDTALAALTGGIAARESATLEFLGILDPE
jgi:hypothetical protein